MREQVLAFGKGERTVIIIIAVRTEKRAMMRRHDPRVRSARTGRTNKALLAARVAGGPDASMCARASASAGRCRAVPGV